MSEVDGVADPTELYSSPLDDPEYNGSLNRATAQGAKFALLLAMLEQDSLLRPTIDGDDAARPDYYQQQISLLSYYRQAPLAADSQYWCSVKITADYVGKQDIDNARLWLAMYPESLSLHNDAKYIPSVVIENCSLPVQERLLNARQRMFKQDVTGLYDVLQKVAPQGEVL